MFSLNVILLGALLPAAVSVLAIVACRWLRPSVEGRLVPALAVGSAYLAGHAATTWPAWPPVEASDRVPLLVLAVLVLSLFSRRWEGSTWLAWGIRVLLTGVTVAALLAPAVHEGWWNRETALQFAVPAIVMLLGWTSLDGLARRAAGSTLFVPLLVLTAGTGLSVALAGAPVAGRLGGILAAALTGGWLVSWRIAGLGLSRGAVAVVGVVLASVEIIGYVYAYPSSLGASLLALAPLAPWLGLIGRLRRGPWWVSLLVATIATLLVVGAAVGIEAAAMADSGY